MVREAERNRTYIMKLKIRLAGLASEDARARLAACGLRCTATILLWFLMVSVVAGQGASAPTKTACKGWDNAFLTTFHTAFVLVLIGTCLLGLFLPLLAGHIFWWVTASRARIVRITMGMLAASILGVIIYPRFIGLGNFGYSGINPRYLDCEGIQFGASGLFGGLLGRDVAAISQWPAMLALLCIGAVSGGILAFLISEALVKALGVTSKVSGEGS